MPRSPKPRAPRRPLPSPRGAIVAALLAALPAAGHGFEIDLPAQEWLERTHPGTLVRAAPGDTLQIHTDFLCHRRGRLLVYAHAPDEAIDDFHWNATMATDASVALEGRWGGGAADRDDLLFEIETVLLWQHCEDAVLTADGVLGAFVTVATVNGERSLSALLGEPR